MCLLQTAVAFMPHCFCTVQALRSLLQASLACTALLLPGIGLGMPAVHESAAGDAEVPEVAGGRVGGRCSTFR